MTSIYSRKSIFRNLVVVAVVMFHFDKHISKNCDRHRDESLYTDEIPLPSVQCHIEFFVNNK